MSMGLHSHPNGHRGEDGSAAVATLEAPVISTAFAPQRLVPLPLPMTEPRRPDDGSVAVADDGIVAELADAARSIDGDKVIRVLTAVVVLAVAGFAAVVSYNHIFVLGRLHGQDGTAARLLPLSVDGLIAAASLVMLHAARNGIRLRLVSWPRAMLVLGVAATVAANVFYGLPFGWLAAVISAWPAVAFIGSVEMAMRLVRDARHVPADDGLATDDGTVGRFRQWQAALKRHGKNAHQEPDPQSAIADTFAPVTEAPPEPVIPSPLNGARKPVTPRAPRRTAHDKAVAALKRHGDLSDAKVAAKAGVSEATVRRAREGLNGASS